VVLGMLTGASVRISGVDVQADEFLYLTPYELVFRDELFRLFTGLWTGEYRLFAPRISTDADWCEAMNRPIGDDELGCYLDRPIASYLADYIDPRDLTLWPKAAAMGTPVEVDVPFIVQSWTITNGMSLFGYDRLFDFQDSNYVWLKAGEKPSLPDPPTNGLGIIGINNVGPLNEFVVPGDETLRFPTGTTIRVQGSTCNDGDYEVAGPGARSEPPNTIIPIVDTTRIPCNTADGYIPEPYWDVMECHDPRLWNGQTWSTLRLTDGAADDRPAVIWMRRCKLAQHAVEQSTPGTPEYDEASRRYDSVVWRLDWMRALNRIWGHTPDF